MIIKKKQNKKTLLLQPLTMKAGSLLSIKTAVYGGAIQEITGICLSIKNKGLDSFLILQRNVGSESHIIQKFLLYSPFVIAIKQCE
jgi:ribosomal protein L19